MRASSRNTVQKKVILEAIRSVKSHPTADELFSMVRRSLPNISLATVYMNLEQMSEAGIIKKIEVAGKQKRFDADLSDHCHFRCRDCGAVHDFEIPSISTIIDRLEGVADHDLSVEGYNIEFFGRCSKCRNNSQLPKQAERRD
ncbi:MAG TPA: transcriptional repressor [bacterium]|nr:transcriptional repressor [bacterium]